MHYHRIHWIHEPPDGPSNPVLIYSELADDREEIRKVDEYENGWLDLAGEGVETGSTFLAEGVYPSLEEINQDPHYEAVTITKEEFERKWAEAKRRAGLC